MGSCLRSCTCCALARSRLCPATAGPVVAGGRPLLEALELALATSGLGPHPGGFLACAHGGPLSSPLCVADPRGLGLNRPGQLHLVPPRQAWQCPFVACSSPFRVSVPLDLARRASSLHAGVFPPGCLAGVSWVVSVNL